MATIAVPYHLDERLDVFDLGLPVDHEVTPRLPAGPRWDRMAVLYEQVARTVAAQDSPSVVISGDCTTSLGVLAGLQRAGHDIGIVWFDAHADFHTERTSTSGYLGGMPLALAVGVGTLTLPTALGLRPVTETRTVLIDARDTDPGERALLKQSDVARVAVSELDVHALPDGDLYLHVDVDVADPREVPELLYPVSGAPALHDILAAIQRVALTGRIVAVGLAATWRHRGNATPTHEQLLRRLTATATATATTT